MSCPFCKKEHAWTVDQALSMLEEGPGRVQAALAGASQAELDTPEAKPGGWTPRQVATHLMDAELMFSVRFRKLLAEDNAVLPAFDQERWSADGIVGGRDIADVLATHALLRKQNLALLRRAGAAGLDRAGNHPEYGRLTVRDHILHVAEHDAKHAEQIKRIRAHGT